MKDAPNSTGAPLGVLAFAGPYASASQQGVLVSLACGLPRSIAEAKVCAARMGCLASGRHLVLVL